MYAEENSLLLYFEASPGPGFSEMIRHVESTLKVRTSPFLHMTLAVSSDHTAIRQLKERLDGCVHYPFTLYADSLSLYHIWKPVSKVKTF